jgi:hypothetical protein
VTRFRRADGYDRLLKGQFLQIKSEQQAAPTTIHFQVHDPMLASGHDIAYVPGSEI